MWSGCAVGARTRMNGTARTCAFLVLMCFVNAALFLNSSR